MTITLNMLKKKHENIVRRRPTADPLNPDARVMRCAFTGYRLQKMPFGFNEHDPLCVDFRARLYETIELLIYDGYSHFISGGALGMDMFAAEAVLQLREKYPHIALEMAIPFDEQDSKWTPAYRMRYRHLLHQADIITYTGHRYTDTCMLVRNHYLVDNADLLLAAYDGQPGGTASTIRYATQLGVGVTCIPPVTQKMLPQMSA